MCSILTNCSFLELSVSDRDSLQLQLRDILIRSNRVEVDLNCVNGWRLTGQCWYGCHPPDRLTLRSCPVFRVCLTGRSRAAWSWQPKIAVSETESSNRLPLRNVMPNCLRLVRQIHARAMWNYIFIKSKHIKKRFKKWKQSMWDAQFTLNFSYHGSNLIKWLEISNNLRLVSRFYTGEASRPLDGVPLLLRREVVKLSSSVGLSSDIVLLSEDADSSTDGHGRALVVSCDHDNTNARFVAQFHCADNLLPGRVKHAHTANKCETHLNGREAKKGLDLFKSTTKYCYSTRTLSNHTISNSRNKN